MKAAAAGIADGAFYNTGQSCCSVERIYVHESIHDAFVAAFVAEVKGYKMGDPMDESTYIGAITRKPQLDVLKKQVADAKKKGAKLLTGGDVVRGKGNWFEPTVFADVDHSMALMKDESFGPIIGIQAVADDDAAVDLMNDTEYGLTAGVYTNDAKRARKILARVNAGSVYWNCCDRVSPRLPWSGVGHSGIGLTLSTLRHPDIHAAEGVAFARRVNLPASGASHLTPRQNERGNAMKTVDSTAPPSRLSSPRAVHSPRCRDRVDPRRVAARPADSPGPELPRVRRSAHAAWRAERCGRPVELGVRARRYCRFGSSLSRGAACASTRRPRLACG